MKSPLAIVLSLAMVTFGALVGLSPAEGGLVEYIPLDAGFSPDEASGISPDNYYTHLLDFGTSTPASINGVDFTQVTMANIDDVPGFNFAVDSGSRSDHAGNAAHSASGGMADLLTDMIYNGGCDAGGVATITLSDLTPGTEYITRLYTRQWGISDRNVMFDFDTTGDGIAEDNIPLINEDNAVLNPPNFDGWFYENTPYMLSYRFTAESDRMSIAMTQFNQNHAWHVYGLSNQELGVQKMTWDGFEWTGGDEGASPDAQTMATVQGMLHVSENLDLRSLSIQSGGVSIVGGTTLTILDEIESVAGTSLTIGPGATMRAGLGELVAVALSGNGKIGVNGGVMRVFSLDNTAPGTLTKQGAGTLYLDNTAGGISGSTNVFRVQQGTLSSKGINPLGNADTIELAGGRLTLEGYATPSDGPEGAIAYYSFDQSSFMVPNEGSASSLLDGYFTGDAKVTTGNRGKVGEAASFDGNGDYIEVLHDASLELSTFTVSAWVNIASEPGNYGILGTRNGGPDTTFDLKVGGNLIHGDVGSGSGWINTGVDITAGDTGSNGQGGDLAVGQWYQVTYVVDNDAKQFKLYLDGDLKKTISYTGDPLFMQPGQALWIGDDYGGHEYFDGLIDEVYIYGRALDDTEVDDLWGDGFGPNDGDAGLNMSGVAVVVSADSTLNPIHGDIGGGPTPFGVLTMEGGVLTTTGNAEGIRFQSTIVKSGTQAVGFDPQVPTDYGVIDANSTGVVLSKAGPSIWLLDSGSEGYAAPIHMELASWRVDEGELQLAGTDPLAGRPIEVAGGVLYPTEKAVLDGITVTLSGGTLTVKPSGELTTVENTLQERWFDGTFNDDLVIGTIDGSGGGMLTVEPGAYRQLDTALNFDGPEMDQRSGGVTGVDTLGAVWYGKINIGGSSPVAPGPITFGTASDDGTGLLIDINRNGSFEPNELIVDNGGSHGVQNRIGTVDLPEGSYDIALGYYEVVGGEHVEVKFIEEAYPGDPANQDQVNAYYWFQMEKFVDPSDPAQAGLWTGYQHQPIDFDGTDLILTADSVIAAVTDSTATFGSLTLQSGMLTTGNPGAEVVFSGTIVADTLDPVGFDTQTVTRTGPIDAGSHAVTIVKAGPSDLIVDGVSSGLEAAIIDVQEGRLIAVQELYPVAKGNGFGAATLQLSGGEVVLAGTNAPGLSVAFPNAVVVEADSTITAADAAMAMSAPVVLGDAENGITLGAGILTLRSVDDSTLTVAGAFEGDAAVRVSEGSVTLVGGGKVGELKLDGGLLALDADLGASTMTIGQGTADTGTSRVLVSETLSVGGTPFTITDAPSFAVTGSDLQAEADLTLSGGTLTVGAPFAIAKDISSGFDNTTGAVIAASQPDPDYTITPGDIVATVLAGGGPVGSAWMANSGTAKWIGFDTAESSADPGDYEFTTTVDLDGFDAATATISGGWSTDNAGLDILVNGVGTGHTSDGNFGIFHPVEVGPGLFQPGLNTITFRFNNALAGPAGLRVDAAVYAGNLDAPVDRRDVNLIVAADSTLHPNVFGRISLGDLTLQTGADLSVENVAEVSFENINAADGTTVSGADVAIRGILSPGVGLGEVVFGDDLTMNAGSQLLLDVKTDGSDLVTSSGSVVLETDSLLTLRIDGKSPFTAGTYPLITSTGEDPLDGTFTAVEGLAKYATSGIAGDGLTYEDGGLSLKIDFDLHSGDANLDTTTDVRDFNVWNTNKFTSGTTWSSGDFTGDGTTDVRDFNVWNTAKFTSVDPAAPVAGGQVPEPGTLALLLMAAAAFAAVGRYRRP